MPTTLAYKEKSDQLKKKNMKAFLNKYIGSKLIVIHCGEFYTSVQ